MLRQRVRTETHTSSGLAGRIVVLLVAAALFWYGLMLLLLAVKVDPGFVNSISGYRSAFDYLAGLMASDIDSTTRAIVAGAGVLAFLVFGFLALRALPRPYLARHDLTLDGTVGQALVVEARALERAAEVAAREEEGVASAQARAGAERIEVDVSLERAERIGDALAGVRSRVRDALELHGLPLRPVDVALTGFDETEKKEIL